MTKKIYLGTVKENLASRDNREKGNLSFIQGSNIYLEKHEWQCDWYWSFGYISGSNVFTHFDTIFLEGNGGLWWNADEIFKYSIVDDKKLWILKDLYKQAYTLKQAAEVYQYGGHCASGSEDTKIIQNKTMADTLNADLEKVLNHIWELLEQWTAEYKKAKKKGEQLPFLFYNHMVKFTSYRF